VTGEAAPAQNQAACAVNMISGGIQFAPVLQGRDVQATFQLQAAAPVALEQLPAPVAGFTGREDELKVLAALLDPAGPGGPVVVSAVAGLAGVGKTTLAVAAGHAALKRGWFSGGVLFIDLHGYRDDSVEPGQALDGLLRSLGVPAEHIPPGVEKRAALYRSALAQIAEPVLVIADNASAEAQVRPLVPGTRRHKMLVTSRHTLAGLGARLVDVTILDQDASALLLDVALRIARSGDDRISRDPGAAQRLAGACGGLPLALQITAALLIADPALSAVELADDLAAESSRLERLAYDDGSTGGSRVATAFGLSYRKLEETAARLFRLLPVNTGPDISTAAAAALAGLSVKQARTVLVDLARAHLTETAPGAPGRWRMHDLVRLYATRLSDEHVEADCRERARDRLLGYYLDMARAADAHLRALPGMTVPEAFTGRADALAWLDAERASLVAAPTMAAATGRDEAALHLPLLLAVYLQWRRGFDDLLAITALSLGAARRLRDRQGEGDSLNNLGNAMAEVRRFDEAITTCQNAATIYRETGDRHREGAALNNLGLALAYVHRFAEAITAHQEAAAIFRQAGDRPGEGMALNNLGIAQRQVRRFDEAITAHQGAASIYRQTGDRHSEGTALINLGLALAELRRFEEAITACQEAAAIFRETGDRHSEGTALDSLGLALRLARRFAEAITAHQDAATIYRQTGDRHRQGTALTNLGAALPEMRRFDEAITACQDAAVIFRQAGDRHREGTALTNLGIALRQVDRFDEAITAHQDAATIYRQTGDRHREGMALEGLGLALHAGRRSGEAITAYQDAIAIYHQTGDQYREGIAQKYLKRARRAQPT
jgi:tetratricopeptide (TPR) repeat protein